MRNWFGEGTKLSMNSSCFSEQVFPGLNLIRPKRTSLQLLVPSILDNCYVLVSFVHISTVHSSLGEEEWGNMLLLQNHCSKNSQNINGTVLASKGYTGALGVPEEQCASSHKQPPNHACLLFTQAELKLFEFYSSQNSDGAQWPIMNSTCAYLNYYTELNNSKKGFQEYFFNNRFSSVFHNWIQKLKISFCNLFMKFVWKILAFIQKKYSVNKKLQKSQLLVTKQPNYSQSTWQIHRPFLLFQ